MSLTAPDAKHAVLADRLRELVADLTPGAALPSERRLAEQWGVARMTVRQALAALAREGLVVSHQGRGHLRAPDTLRLSVRLGSFADALRSHDLSPSTTVLHHAVEPAPAHVVETLGEVTTLHVHRLRLGDDVPLAVEHAWFPASLVADPGTDALAGSLYDHLDGLSLLPDAGEETVTAALPTPEEARLLAMHESRPVLRLVRRATSGGVAVEHAEAVFPADRYELGFPLSRS
ncbi:GntR family transcriptional regulator [Solicola sp. PLA-1-18]|uniref:GntR family transcriptional regulator n=1 Tax=Solicola sp. PLA-1-18 TaxID=3380532 RepID=UPI003B7FA6C6